jgi:general secretion pathway protein G
MIREDIQRRIVRRAAFTLMEVLIVVAIIVILASLGGFLLIDQYETSKVGTAEAKIHTIEQAVETYYLRTGDYPADLSQLVGTALKKPQDIIDPWGNQYQYAVDGQTNSYRVWTVHPRTRETIPAQ